MIKTNSHEPYDKRFYRWYAISILALAYAVSYIDRLIISLMVDPIKLSLDLSDTQVSLLLGLSFAIFYTTSAIPIAWLADRFNRRNIIISGITAWCSMTAICGLVKTFPALFVARMGVGLGEASLAPAGNSLIADAVPKESLGKALALFASGIAAGVGIAMMAGGYVLSLIGPNELYQLPIIGEIAGWQLTFVVVGLGGLGVGALMLTVKEPKRRKDSDSDNSSDNNSQKNATIGETLDYFAKYKWVYISLYLGYACAQTAFYAAGGWVPTLFTRVYQWNIAEFGFYYGAITAAVGVLGVSTGGALCDVLYKKGFKYAHWIITMAALSFLALYGFLAVVESGFWAMILLGFGSFSAFAAAPAAPAAIIMLTPNRFRAMATALFFFSINIIGMIFGPLLVAILTESVFKDPLSIGTSIGIVSIVGLVLSLIILGFGFKHYKKRILEIESAPIVTKIVR